MQHFGVARMTIRNALQVLQGEGLTVAEHGRGVFVRSHPPVRRLASDRFARRHREQGKAAFIAETEGAAGSRPSTHHDHGRATVGRCGRVARDRPEDRVIARSRRYLINGQPVEYGRLVHPGGDRPGHADRAAGQWSGGIYARLEELGYRLDHFVEEIRSRMPLR